MAAGSTLSRRYVWLQLGGWGLTCALFCSIALVYLQYSHHAITRAIVGRVLLSYGLYMSYGLLLSHLLHLGLRRWMKLPLNALLLRIVPSLLLTASLLTAALILINDRALHLTMGKIDQAIGLSLFFNNGIMLLGWIIIYALIYTARERRREESRRLAMELAAQEAQYRSLSARVNPHFLFNALNTIRALMYEDTAQADHALTRLAGLLRAGLRSEERREIPLKDELEVVTDYLQLEQMRFEQRLRVHTHIAPGAERALVPPMTVQHLVENAVKHGIERIEAGGEIILSAQVIGAELEISVTNPVARSAQASQESTGTGLENTRQRLQLLYGTLATLELHIHQTTATVTLRLPHSPQEIQEI